MALSDCSECWMTPCICGHEYKNWSQERKDELTKAINGFSIKEVFEWLSENHFISDEYSNPYKQFMRDNS